MRYVVLDDGTPLVWDGVVLPVRNVNIATNSFTAGGGDQYPLGDLPFFRIGLSYQRALFNYIVQRLGGSIDAASYPEGGEGRIRRGQ